MEKKESSKLRCNHTSGSWYRHVLLVVHHGNFTCSVGGAERLIVDAAMELASHGHNVHIFTSHHDKNRCFEETLSG
ncbi:Alpha-1 3/1 6-mannosyltransferase ALG2 [Bienertia sinuspersici]